jgi:superfamily II DNA/RNA helicase
LSLNNISIKPNNHRIYQCPSEKKLDLLNKLILDNAGSEIVVVSSKDPQNIKDNLENKEIKVVEDRELVKDKELQCEIIIGFDIPIKDIVYIARAQKATVKSFMLLDESEQKNLHAIEALLGRAIKQEKVEDFNYVVIQKDTTLPARKSLSKDEIKEVAKKRYEASTQEKPKRDFRKDKPSDGKWDKKKKAPNKFLGKDENGKALFSGKSGERNHRHDGTSKDIYDAPKTTGKVIKVKAKKK